MTYSLRVELTEIEPVIWRQIEVRSDLTLPELHLVLQAALGWNYSHLHLWENKHSPADMRGELYLAQSSLDEGMPGSLETDVSVDELLAAPGDTIEYEYDFGDSWRHLITLQAVRELPAEAEPAVCTDGARSAPPDDSGGVPGYQMLVEALADPGHPEHREYRTWAGPDFDPEDFSVSKANARLSIWARRRNAVIPTGLVEVLGRLRGPSQEQLWQWILDAQPAVPVTDEMATRLTHPYRWLLERVGSKGIKLTSAGFLPPSDVAAASAALDFGDEWIGTLNRESQTIPMLDLRESAQHLGLLRKAKGHLSVTAAGMKVTNSPIGLVRHIASRLPLGKASYQQQAGLMALLHLAAGQPPDFARIAEILSALGWQVDRGAMTERDAYWAAEETIVVLRRLHVQPSWSRKRSEEVTEDARAFAAAAAGLTEL